MKCPICSQELKSDPGHLVRCSRGHRFYVQWFEDLIDAGDSSRRLVLAVDADSHKSGKEWPIPESEMF